MTFVIQNSCNMLTIAKFGRALRTVLRALMTWISSCNFSHNAVGKVLLLCLCHR